MRQKAHAIDKPASTYRERIVLFHTDLLIRRNRVSPQAKGQDFTFYCTFVQYFAHKRRVYLGLEAHKIINSSQFLKHKRPTLLYCVSIIRSPFAVTAYPATTRAGGRKRTCYMFHWSCAGMWFNHILSYFQYKF